MNFIHTAKTFMQQASQEKESYQEIAILALLMVAFAYAIFLVMA